MRQLCLDDGILHTLRSVDSGPWLGCCGEVPESNQNNTWNFLCCVLYTGSASRTATKWADCIAFNQGVWCAAGVSLVIAVGER
jgi:hypothetical protein